MPVENSSHTTSQTKTNLSGKASKPSTQHNPNQRTDKVSSQAACSVGQETGTEARRVSCDEEHISAFEWLTMCDKLPIDKAGDFVIIFKVLQGNWLLSWGTVQISSET